MLSPSRRMKFLITAGARFENLAPGQPPAVRGTSDAYALNLSGELSRRGHHVDFAITPKILTERDLTPDQIAQVEHHFSRLGDYDHAVSTAQNGFETLHPIFFELIRAHTRGKVCTILDHDIGDGPEDLLLHARRPTGHSGSRAAYIGWAADGKLFAPAKEEGWLTVFVDHKYYDDPEVDWTERLIGEAMRFCRSYEAGRFPAVAGKLRARVIFLGPNGLEVVEAPEIRRFRFGKTRRQWAKRVDQTGIAAALAKSDLYVVTHKETMGLATLEAAMAGALIVTPRHFVRPELLQPLHHSSFDEQPDWAHALHQLDVARSVEMASRFTWERLVDRLLAALDRVPEPVAARAIGDRLTIESASVLAPQPEDWQLIRLTRQRSLFARKGPLVVRAKPAAGLHQLRTVFHKSPWPVLYTASFMIAADGCDGCAIVMVSRLGVSARAEAQFDLAQGRVARVTGKGGWQVIGAAMHPAGDGQWRCIFQVLSDYMPEVELRIGMLRGGEASFTAEDKAELRIERVELREGLTAALPA